MFGVPEEVKYVPMCSINLKREDQRILEVSPVLLMLCLRIQVQMEILLTGSSLSPRDTYIVMQWNADTIRT